MKRSILRLTAGLALLPLLLAVSACGNQGKIRAALPSAADLTVEPKPMPSVDILTNSKAEAKYNSEIESWGDRGWSTVARLCRWAREHGSPAACPHEGDHP